MFITAADRIRQRAIENIERLALDAIAAISKPNEHLDKKTVEREGAVGLAQAAAELAYAGLIAAKSGVRPDGVELDPSRTGFNDAFERKAVAATRSMVRRLKDNQ